MTCRNLETHSFDYWNYPFNYVDLYLLLWLSVWFLSVWYMLVWTWLLTIYKHTPSAAQLFWLFHDVDFYHFPDFINLIVPTWINSPFNAMRQSLPRRTINCFIDSFLILSNIKCEPAKILPKFNAATQANSGTEHMAKSLKIYATVMFNTRISQSEFVRTPEL